jgi:hypothetical protein
VGNEVVVVLCAAIRKRERRRGGWAKNRKSNGGGSISGGPLEMSVWSDRGRWWGGAYEATAIVK